VLEPGQGHILLCLASHVSLITLVHPKHALLVCTVRRGTCMTPTHQTPTHSHMHTRVLST